MYIYYRGAEKKNGYVKLLQLIHGGYLVEVDDQYADYVDWGSVDYIKVVSESAATVGRKMYGRSYVEYWTRDDDPNIISTTFRPTKKSDGTNKDLDENGFTWTKVKRDLTAEETAAALEIEKAVANGMATSWYLKKVKELDVQQSDFEMALWPKQEAQARAFQADGTIGVLLQTLADARGLTVEDMSQKIIDKADAYEQAVGTVLGLLQEKREAIKAITTMADMLTWRQQFMGIKTRTTAEEMEPLESRTDETYDPMAVYTKSL